MKILSIVPLMIYNAGTNPNQTHINKNAAHTLNASIPTLKDISNEVKWKIINEFNKTLYFNVNNFTAIKNSVLLTGEISEKRLNVNFLMINDLDQLNDFNEEIASFLKSAKKNNKENESLLELEKTKITLQFISIVIALINNIFQSRLPKEDIVISNEESHFLINLMSLFKNQNQIKISVKYASISSKITFNCYLAEDSNNVVKTSNPNEAGEEEEPLLDKKTQ